ncbi:MAG TPA: L,D-transpeptidase family protein [Candidatus Binataceae bacterium]|nr:L,D-transpeptidase family protein [Candidatus Binataceae bacterium]
MDRQRGLRWLTGAAATVVIGIALPVQAQLHPPTDLAARQSRDAVATTLSAQPAAVTTSPPLSPIDHVLVLTPVAAGSSPAKLPPTLSPIDHQLIIPVGAAASSKPLTVASASLPSAPQEATPGAALLASLGLLHTLTPGVEALSRTRDESFRDPVMWSVMAYKSAHVMRVYYRGYLFASYAAVFGRNREPGAKRWAGDLKTPEGVYQLISKYRSSRWKWFLRINYPNALDLQRYRAALRAGEVPVVGGRRRPVGDDIGIHGTDRPRFNKLGLDWTLGCISIDNDAIDVLERLLPVGTLVVIKP